LGALSLLFVPLFGAPKPNTSKIRERDVTSALGGHHLVGQHKNQPKVDVRGRRDIAEDARPGQNVWGRRHTIAWGGKLSNKKIKIKKRCVFKWLPIDISNATTNQKHAGVSEERKARRSNRGGAWGKRDSIVLVAKDSGGM
jgi:hypothetical protein